MSAHPSDADLLALQLRTLFRFDPLGRMVATNEPRGLRPPRVFVTRCESIRLVRVRQDVPERLSRSWYADSDEDLRENVAASAPIVSEYRGPAFVLPKCSPGATVAVAIEPGHTLHADLIARGWVQGETAPYFGVIRDRFVVAVCYSARSTDEAAEAGVETAASYRGRGLAMHAVAGWAAAVQASGRTALYSTEWSNEASRRLAGKLGAIQYGENWHFT